MTAFKRQATQFQTADGVRLKGTLFVPADPHTSVVIAGAVGVPETFYARFAEWLAGEGFAVLTFTYRDMHDTSPRAMRRSRARLQDWAITDGQAARDALRAGFGNLPQWVIGHSLGGMMLSKQPRLAGVTRVITIASGLVHHREHPMPYRLLVWFFWFVAGPLTTRMLGYLPGKTIGLGSALPSRVFWQWRKWCTVPGSFLEDTSLPASDWSRSGAPVRIVGICDDAICPPELAHRLARAYQGGPVETVTIDPAQEGVSSLGHFGIFRAQGKAFWPKLIARSSPTDLATPTAAE